MRCSLVFLVVISIGFSQSVIAGAGQFDKVTPLLQARHWLQIEQRITFKGSVMMYKTVNGIAPSYLQEYVIYPPSSRCSLWLQSADTGQLYVPRTRAILGERAFAVAGPRARNSLPVIGRCAPSLATCKSYLKTFRFFVALIVLASHINCASSLYSLVLLILILLVLYISLLFSSLEATCRLCRLINWHVTYIHT